MIKKTVTADYHTHCGQFFDMYYDPREVIKTLAENGIKEAWISSISSGIMWNSKTAKKEVIRIIESEIADALDEAREHGMSLVPLYWVLPKRYEEGESIASIMDGSVYGGFKIHPKIDDWSESNPNADALFTEVCEYAVMHNMPILIHTGYDENVLPKRFEKYFGKYNGVKFVIAHCKDPNDVIEMLEKYDNVFGDTAFCPKDSYDEICKAGFKDRMQPATDFPITNWFYDRENPNLGENLRKVLTELAEMIYEK